MLSAKCKVQARRVKCGVWGGKCEGEARSVKCGDCNVQCKVRSVGCKVWSAKWKRRGEVKSVEFELWSTMCGV